ncbi:sensor histidine kinase [Thalassotalea fusca]
MVTQRISKLGYYKFTFYTSFVLTVVFAAFGSSYQSNVIVAELLAALTWFVCFYWWPLWTAGYLIFKLRNKERGHYLLELLILWISLLIGHIAKDIFQGVIFSKYVFDMENTLVMSISWTLIMYSIARVYEYSEMLISSKINLHKAQAETLRYQLNPHLLFNSLNTISAMIHTNPDEADRILHDLAALLRFSLELSDKEKITVQAELDLIARYISIEKARFGELLTLDTHVDPESNNYLLPPLIVQTLVENAIKHNNKNKPLHINVTIKRVNNKLKISVSDNGVGFPEHVLKLDTHRRVGLKNVKTRIQHCPSSSLSLENGSTSSGIGAIATLYIAQT